MLNSIWKPSMLALLALTLAVTAAPAAADSFAYTGGEQSYKVPDGITKLDVSMSGADGGAGLSLDGQTTGGAGGHGGTVSAVLTVTPGQVLYVEVGQAGGATGVASWNGGAPTTPNPDPDATFLDVGGSGGGATDIRTASCGSSCPGNAATLNSRLLVAGGGGGGGYDTNQDIPIAGSNAGAGGNATAASGLTGGTGSTSAPGAGGPGCDDFAGNSGAAGTPGAGGQGGLGSGDYGGQVVTTSSGGGGGGYQGGGGGGGCAKPDASDYQAGGGGGGSDFASSAASSVSIGVDGTAGKNGAVSINPAPPGLQTAPAIKGPFDPGDTLSAVAGKYNNTPTKLTYQWLRCNASGASCTAISGATGTAWPLTSADLGHTLKVQETASNAYGTAAAALSAATPVIAQPSGPANQQPGGTQQPGGGQSGGGTSAPASTSVRLELSSVKMAGSQATVRLACTGLAGGACEGHVAIMAANQKHGASAKKTAKSRLARAKKSKPLTLARAKFHLSTGAKHKLTVKLNSAGRRLLNKSYRLTAMLKITGTTPLTKQVTFAYRRVKSFVSWTWSFMGARTLIKQLDVTSIPRRGHVTVLCHGTGCSSDEQTFKPGHHGHRLSLATAITKHGHLQAGSMVQVRVSAPNRVAKVITITIRRNHYPKIAKACMPPGFAHPTACA